MKVAVPDGSGRVIEVLTDDKEYAKKRAAEWAKENPFVERGAKLGEEDVSALGDIPRGIGAGLVSAVEGIATLPAEIVDAITDSEESSAAQIRSFFDKYKPETSTGVGEAARFITQFAAPGGLAVKASKGIKAKKALESEGLDATDIATFGVADIAATTPDVETLGDFFDAGPTKRIDTEDLIGAELAAASLANRLKVATEGAAIVLGVPKLAKFGLMGIGKGAEALAETDMAREAARAIKDPNTPFQDVGVKPDFENPTFFQKNIERLKKTYRKYLTVQGEAPDRFVKQYDAIRLSAVAAQNDTARKAVEKISNSVSFINKNEGLFNNFDKSVALKTLNDYLFAEPINRGGVMLSREQVRDAAAKTLNEIDDIIAKNTTKDLRERAGFGKLELSLFNGAEEARKAIDDLSDGVKDLVNDNFVNQQVKENVTDIIEANKGFYGIRLYRAFKDKDYVPTIDKQNNAVKELMKSTEILGPNLSIKTEGEAREILNNMLNSGFTNQKMNPRSLVEEDTLSGVSQGVLKPRTLDNLPAVRDFLGEYTGAKEVIGRLDPEKIRVRDLSEQELGLKTKIVETVDVLAKQVAKSKHYKDLVDYNNRLKADGKNGFLFDEIPPNVPLGNYTQIGRDATTGKIGEKAREKFGPLAGKYVKTEHLGAFENIPRYFDMSNALPLYSTFLGLKGMSQIAKTVYSPITQVRNATTAAFYALMNGNIGNAQALSEAVSTVLSSINQRSKSFGKTKLTPEDIKKQYKEYIDLGIVNTNAKIGEFEALLNDAVDSTQYMPSLAKKGFKKAQNLQNGFSAKLYQGSDDVWKIYSYQMELGKLKKVFEANPNASIAVSDPRNFTEFGAVIKRGEGLTDAQFEQALKREAAEIVKDTVPNYARVPEFIKRLRRLPLGNFIAFPAEIIRTSGNVINRAIKEIASDSPEVRSIGMKRLVGMMSVNAAIPGTLAVGAGLLTGADSDQIKAYKRSMAYDWDRNSTLIPMATDKNGNITEMYNFSYTNPYDYMMRPLRAVYNAVENGVEKEEELTKIAMDASYDSLLEFMAPFASESIITEKMFDIGRNRTSFGAKIYGDADPVGLKIAKQFAHFAEGLTPGISPAEITADVSSPATGYLSFSARDFPKAIGSVAGMDPRSSVTKQGYKIDPMQEFTEAISGVKTIKPRVNRVLYYRGLEAARQVREASSIFNQIAKSRGSKSAEEITKAYITANEQRFKALRDLNMAVEDAKTLGFSRSDIIKPLRQAKTPNLNFIMAGKFNAFFPSSETISFALQGNEDKLSNPLKMRDITAQYREFQGKPFRPKAMQEAQNVRQLPVLPAQPSTPPVQQSEIEPAEPASLFNRGTQALRDLELRKLLGID